MKEYAKLAIVAAIATALTVFVMRIAQEPQPVHASGGALPAIFKKDANIAASASTSAESSTSGKVLSVSGTWVEFSDGSETWWVDMDRPHTYYQVAK